MCVSEIALARFTGDSAVAEVVFTVKGAAAAIIVGAFPEDAVGAIDSATPGEDVALGGMFSEGLGWEDSCGGAPGYGDAPGVGGMIDAVEL